VNDVGEENDLSFSLPEKVAELRRDLAAWRAEVGVETPPPYTKTTEQGAQGDAVNRAP